MGGKFKDLIGLVFGRLTVLERAENKILGGRKRTMWVCQCSCENKSIITVSTDLLNSGQTKSCGCLQKEKASKNGASKLIDLTDKKYGKLTVIKRVENKGEMTMWLCKCSCDEQSEIIVSGGHLKSGHTKSCGCLISDYEDLTKRVYGKWKVIERTSRKGEKAKWLCECQCQNKTRRDVLESSLKNGASQSCGCVLASINGDSKSRLYGIYSSMKMRCYNINDIAYPHYGGRGIKICDEWLNNFMNFKKWSYQNGYKEHLDKYGEDNTTIDRINVNGNYEPDNCRWTDMMTQCNNRRNCKYIKINGITKTIKEWSNDSGINYNTIDKRIKLGWKNEDLLKPPIRKVSKHYSNCVGVMWNKRKKKWYVIHHDKFQGYFDDLQDAINEKEKLNNLEIEEGE